MFYTALKKNPLDSYRLLKNVSYLTHTPPLIRISPLYTELPPIFSQTFLWVCMQSALAPWLDPVQLIPSTLAPQRRTWQYCWLWAAVLIWAEKADALVVLGSGRAGLALNPAALDALLPMILSALNVVTWVVAWAVLHTRTKLPSASTHHKLCIVWTARSLAHQATFAIGMVEKMHWEVALCKKGIPSWGAEAAKKNWMWSKTWAEQESQCMKNKDRWYTQLQPSLKSIWAPAFTIDCDCTSDLFVREKIYIRDKNTNS